MENELKELREKINKCDEIIIKALEKRFRISEKIGLYKLKKNLPVHIPKREKEIIGKRLSKTKLDHTFVKKLFKLIFKTSRKLQKNLKKR